MIELIFGGYLNAISYYLVVSYFFGIDNRCWNHNLNRKQDVDRWLS